MLCYSIIITISFVFILAAFSALIYRGGYTDKIFVKLGWKEYKAKQNWAVFSWNNMLEKLNYQADIVFFGDSIVRGSDFQKQFPHKKIVNLGYSGDTLSGMVERVSMIKALNPQQIFFLGGINGLTDKNVKKSAETYANLLDKISKAVPNAKIYVHCILPLSTEKEKKICKNETIKYFNKLISEIAVKREITFIDIYSMYEKDCVLNPDLTIDGIHLHPHAYDRWAEVLKEYIC